MVGVAQGGEPVVEADGGAGVLDPVAGGGDLGAGQGAGEVGDQGDDRRAVVQGPGDGGEVGEDRVHPGGVEGMAHGEAADRAEPGGDVQDSGLVTGDDDRGGPVDRGDGDLVPEPGDSGPYLVLGRRDRCHRPAGGKGLHEAGPGGDQGAGVGKGEDPGDVRGGDLPQRVAQEEAGRGHPEGFQEPVQSRAQGEQGRLGVQSLAEPVTRPGEHDIPERHREIQQTAGLVQGGGEHGITVIKITAHARPLRPLAGEQERGGAAAGRAAAGRRPGIAAGQDSQPGQQLLPGPPDDRRTVLEMSTGSRQGPAGIPRPSRGHARITGQAPGLITERRRGPGRQQPRNRTRRRLRLTRHQDTLRHQDTRRLRLTLHQGTLHQGTRRHQGTLHQGTLHQGTRRRLRCRRGAVLAGGGRLLDDEVRVGAADAERRDPGPARAPGQRPGHRLGEQGQGSAGPVDVRGGPGGVQRRGELVMGDGLDHLDDAADARPAAWVWPRLDLRDPTCRGRGLAGDRRRPGEPGPRWGRPAWCRCRGPR